MPLLDYDYTKKIWIQYSCKDFEGKTRPPKMIYLDGKLKEKLDFCKKMLANNWDVIGGIDGGEGSGKNNLGFSVAWYMSDANLTPNNIAESAEDAFNKLKELPDGSVLIIDEASMAFASTEVMTREQRKLTQILNIIRQKQMFLLLIAPSFFNLSKYVSVERSKFLLHVYAKNGCERGYFAYYGDKRKRRLYSIGKKNYNSYRDPKPNFRGRFTKFEPFGQEYRDLKKRTLMKAFEKEDPKKKSKTELMRGIILNIMTTKPQLKQKEIAELVGVTPRTIRNYLSAERGETS